MAKPMDDDSLSFLTDDGDDDLRNEKPSTSASTTLPRVLGIRYLLTLYFQYQINVQIHTPMMQ